MIYIAGKKLVTVPMGQKGQIMRVLHKIYVGSTDKGHNVILLMRRDTDPKYIELNNTPECAISGSLEVRVGGNTEELGTLSPMHDLVCW